MNLLKKENGFSLLDILISLSLLSIVLLVFVRFFFQAETFTIINKDNSSAAQLSQEVLEKVKASPYQTDLKTADWNQLYRTNVRGEFLIQVNDQIFFPIVKIKPASSQINSFPTQLNLYYIQIEIWANENGQRVEKYETYGFK